MFFGDSPGYYATAFTSTIIMAFLIFILTSADPFCKKIFLFISYANVFSMFMCISLIICSVFLKEASELFVYYARTIIRTILFVPVAFIYKKLPLFLIYALVLFSKTKGLFKF